MVRKQLFLGNWILGALSKGSCKIPWWATHFVFRVMLCKETPNCWSTWSFPPSPVAHNTPHTTSILISQQNPLITEPAAISTPGISATPNASNLKACWPLYLTSLLLLKSFFQGEKFGSTISVFPGDGSATTENSWVVELLRWLFRNLPV